MNRFNPFPTMDMRYGAPMGRRNGSEPVGYNPMRIAAQRQGGGFGYDRGGAYWGTPSDVWAVWLHGAGPKTVKYVRANTREGAIAKGMQL